MAQVEQAYVECVRACGEGNWLMKILPTDLIVRLDQDTNQVTFWICPTGNPDTLLRLYAIDIDAFAELDSLANELGASVAAFLASKHPRGLPKPEPGETLSDRDAEPSLFDDARTLIDRIDSESTIDDVLGIDALLQRAATEGGVEENRYLKETWPQLREIFIRRIKG